MAGSASCKGSGISLFLKVSRPFMEQERREVTWPRADVRAPLVGGKGGPRGEEGYPTFAFTFPLGRIALCRALLRERPACHARGRGGGCWGGAMALVPSRPGRRGARKQGDVGRGRGVRKSSRRWRGFIGEVAFELACEAYESVHGLYFSTLCGHHWLTESWGVGMFPRICL